MGDGKFVLKGPGSNVIGSFGSGSMVQEMPPAYSFGTADTSTAGSFIDCGDEAEVQVIVNISLV